MTKARSLVPIERIESRILVIRDHKVMLDKDLAELYQVETRVLNQAVRRNRERFPDDFMFQLSWEETRDLRSRFVTLNENEGRESRSQPVTLKRGRNIKYRPCIRRPFRQGMQGCRALAREASRSLHLSLSDT